MFTGGDILRASIRLPADLAVPWPSMQAACGILGTLERSVGRGGSMVLRFRGSTTWGLRRTSLAKRQPNC
eukprot:1177650-Prorocentrum_minimum.AAC.1